MTIGAAQQFFLGASKATGGGGAGYQIERSLRFNSSDSASCARTFTSSGNRRTWTWAAWIKRSAISFSAEQHLWGVTGATDATYGEMFFGTGDTLRFAVGYTTTYGITTTRVFRDPAAWFPVVLAFDVTQSTAANKIKLYINGVEETTFSSDTRSSLANQDWGYNNNVAHYIGRNPNSDIRQSNVYLADVYFIDGQALTPSSFTEVSATTGQLIPKAYTGSYGTNGFHLPFSDNSTAAALGTDTSGNGNSWTVNNIAPSNGATYSNRGSLSSSPPTLSGTISDIFDGLLNSSNAFSVNQANAGVTINFSPALPSGSSVKLVGGVYGTAGSNNSLQVNGTGYAQSLPASTGTYTEIVEVSVPAGASGITSIYIYREGISTFNFALYGIKVNDVLLVDGAAGDSLVDTPTSAGTDSGLGGQVTGNYCTWNPLDNAGTLANGNLDFSNGASNKACRSTFALPASGNWYAEFTTGTLTNGASGLAFGFANASAVLTNGPSGANQWVIYSDAIGYIFANGSTLTNSLGTFAAGTTLQIAYDGATGKAWVGKNNVWYNSTGGTTGDPAAGTNQTFTLSGTQFLYTLCFSNSGSLNAGQRPFAYTAPSGFKALCDTNLPSPLIAKPSTVMDVLLYTGNGGTQTISGLGFSPDFVWTKVRNIGYGHRVWDTVRGATKRLETHDTTAEVTETTALTAFNSDGFTVGSEANVNQSGRPYVAWCWDAGSSTVTNTQGSITSSVRANQSAGFSVVSVPGYTYPTKTAGHGLGVEPHFIITKNRGASNPWIIYHKAAGANTYFQFDTGAGYTGVPGVWSGVSSTVFPINSGVNQQTDIIAYCFAPVSGYSSFGSYTGNGSADGPFVFCNFRPRFLLVKRSDASGEPWIIHDSVRDSYNGYSVELYPNNSNAEGGPYSPPVFDFLSNGFKIRSGGATAVNASGGTFIFMALAESPFAYSRAR